LTVLFVAEVTVFHSERIESVTSPQSVLNLTLRVAAAIAEFSET